MPPIIIVDTSVLLNVLDVPGFNQDRNAVLDEFGELVDAGASLLLPMGAVFETGNHIADVRDGRQRRSRAVFRAACEILGACCRLVPSSILLVSAHCAWTADWMPVLAKWRHAERWK